MWLKYYSELLNWDIKLTQEIFTNDKPYIVDTEKGLSRIVNNKAVGLDKVPGEWIKIKRFKKKNMKWTNLKFENKIKYSKS